jgi:hypothetical protein
MRKVFGKLKINYGRSEMTKLLVIITCVVVLTAHWGTFKDKVNINKTVDVITNIIQKVKE